MKMFIFGALFGVNVLGVAIQLVAGKQRDLLVVHLGVAAVAFGAAALS